jgi:RHS repeat-associated protein
MAGDKFNIRVASGWSGTSPTNSQTNVYADLFGSVTNSLAAHSAGKATAVALQSPAAGIGSALTAFLNSQPAASNTPKAYLAWLLFDEQFKLVSTGAQQVGASGATTLHVVNGQLVTKSGYLYVYTSNEATNMDVFFDNLQVTHIQGALLEETHYYPFGLVMAGISSKAAGTLQNKEKTFQGQRFDDDFGLNWVQFKWRNHDPQIGRFIEIDPLSEKYFHNSTYGFSENKVTAHVELEGLEAKLAIAGNGNNASYNPEDVNAFNARAKNLEKTSSFTASQVRNGKQLVDQLKQGTTSEGSVGAVVIFAHTSQYGVYLDKEDGFYKGSDSYGGSNSSNVSELKRAVNAGEVKFDENAVIVLGGCNCGKGDGTNSLAGSMAQELGVTVYAADGKVYPEVVNGKETGRLKTDGTFRMYRKTPEITIDVPGYGTITIPAGVGTTNVGKTIDPVKLVPQKSNN